MQKILVSLLLIIMAFSLMVVDAQAKRFGGGKSFGYSPAAKNFSHSNAFTNARQAAARAPSSMSKWLGPLAGFAIGGLLASLFMGHGFGAGMMSWALVAGACFLIWQLIGRLKQPGRPAMPATALQAPAAEIQSTNSPIYGPLPTENMAGARPSGQFIGFDVAAFLRQAKTTFIRLQAAYDHKNLADVREFTSPEVFAEIQMQLHERDPSAINQTEVISIEAELIDHTNDLRGITASVQFSALVREQTGAAAEAVKEIWHFTREKDHIAWLVAGIQQS